ncbi:homoserine kinase [Rubidibacter lacunae KORDI 51-2]|uniref:Homoserine kinase n=1 Tax=Rubidibacter lacunae KORDI 51-2 TaxID=582515 RepID=U5DBF0_9CHRO|nr:homoserine kinase [Rubidibacter lacunae]ERN41873.1 homoserine kinase [Rubidibacter lacunae KORDI 51-2]
MTFAPFAATVPATTANLGPGFDCLGVALQLYNKFLFAPASKTSICAIGPEADRVATDERNLLYRAYRRYFDELGWETPPIAIEIRMGVPLARGLGSSATAIVGGLVAADRIAGSQLKSDELADMATAIEGHPDNVVPALFGGCCLSASDDTGTTTCQLPWHDTIVPVVAIPDFELSTAAARAVLPDEFSRADAVFNVAHFGMLVRGLATGNGDLVRVGMSDRLHQPYRLPLISGWEQVRSAARAAGAWGVAISGAGPTLLALTPSDRAPAVADAMAVAWRAKGIEAIARPLALDRRGASACASAGE